MNERLVVWNSFPGGGAPGPGETGRRPGDVQQAPRQSATDGGKTGSTRPDGPSGTDTPATGAATATSATTTTTAVDAGQGIAQWNNGGCGSGTKEEAEAVSETQSQFSINTSQSLSKQVSK